MNLRLNKVLFSENNNKKTPLEFKDKRWKNEIEYNKITIYLLIACLRICDFYNGVFCQRVIVKKRIYKASFFTTKTPCISPPPPPRYVTPQFQNMHIFHRPFMLNMIWESCLLSCYVTFCISTFPFFFLFNPGEIMWSAGRAPLFLWVKRGVKRRKKQVSIPPFTEGKALRQGRGFSHRPRLRGTGISAGSAARTEAWRECLSVHECARAEI